MIKNKEEYIYLKKITELESQLELTLEKIESLKKENKLLELQNEKVNYENYQLKEDIADFLHNINIL